MRYWLLFVLVYTAGSLLVFDVTRSWIARGGICVPAYLKNHLRATVKPGFPKQAVFSIPFKLADMELTGQYKFMILPGTDLPRCTVQVLAEGDHHFSFLHVYRGVPLSSEGFAFTVPMSGDPAYWKALGHSAPWTAWERCGLRRLEVKVFSQVHLAGAGLELRFMTEPSPAPAPKTRLIRPPADSISLGGRFELAFNLDGWNGNPFDYSKFPLELEVTEPDGKKQRILPFLYQDFEAVSLLDGEHIRPKGPKYFLARYRPVHEGQHEYRLLLRQNDEAGRVMESGKLQVAAGMAPAFLRVSKRAPHFFERADGRFVYLVGWNLPYPVDRPYGVDYVPYLPTENSLSITRKMLDYIADSGGNFIRFWMSDWWNGLEWNSSVDNYSGIGRYNLKNAWLNDQVMEHCERRGIYIQLETLNHVRLSKDFGWPKHPYNEINGGFLRGPRWFWIEPETRKWSENSLSYTVARYADSPAIQSWNLMSEPDNVSNKVWKNARDMIVSQMKFVNGIDPYGHITSNHMCIPNRDISFFTEDVIQFVNSNAYPGLGRLSGDQIQAIRDFSIRYYGHERPIMVSECAGHWAGDPAFKMARDTLGSLWAGIASNMAGTPMSWWWNFNYGEDMGKLYRVVSDFMKDEDLIGADASPGGRWLNCNVNATSKAGNLRALVVGNATRRFIFAYNFDVLCRTRQIPSLCTGNKLVFDGMSPGDYMAEYWDLRRGRTPVCQDLRVVADGTATLEPPEFTEGWAVKIIPRPAFESDAGKNKPVAAEPSVTPQPKPDLPVNAGADSGSAHDWSWQIRPMVDRIAPASGRLMIEVYIALPDTCRNLYPCLQDGNGGMVPFAWEPLEVGAGWHLRVPVANGGSSLRLTAVAEKPVGTLEINEELFGLGVTVAADSMAQIKSIVKFKYEFARLADKKTARVGCINQLENPLGRNRNFLALYQGPLLVPIEGSYVFATNSDDASFVSIDGAEVVSWPDYHDMEVLDRPMADKWCHRGRITLKKGMHWVEYFHQQGGGACLARLAWELPSPADTKENFPLVPFKNGGDPAIGVVPEWAFDGRIPCSVDVQFKGLTLATVVPCLGLELRRPEVRIYTVAVEGRNGCEFKYFQNGGWQQIEANGRLVPVWAQNTYWRRFSMEWEECVDSKNRPSLKIMLYDIDMPLSVQFEDGQAMEKTLARRTWKDWRLPPGGGGKFVISACKVPLLRGALGGQSGIRPSSGGAGQ